MTVTKKQAQAALDAVLQITTQDHRETLQSLIDALPDDPESREEMLGRVCCEKYYSGATYGMVFQWAESSQENKDWWIAAAAAVADLCKPREVTEKWMIDNFLIEATDAELSKLNRYVRGEDA